MLTPKQRREIANATFDVGSNDPYKVHVKYVELLLKDVEQLVTDNNKCRIDLAKLGKRYKELSNEHENV